MAESATTPCANFDVMREWASQWADTFDQDWNVEKLASFVGKKIRGERPPRSEDEGPKGFVGGVVGYSIDTILYPVEGAEDYETVYRHSFILDTGSQVGIFTGMTIEEITEE